VVAGGWVVGGGGSALAITRVMTVEGSTPVPILRDWEITVPAATLAVRR
jgi:hypothetical protein